MMEQTKQRIIDLLMSTNRTGMDKLVEHMDKNGFFTAPCSGAYHLAKNGGLSEHSLNVYDQMFQFAQTTYFNDELESKWQERIIITSLLHDLGKIGQFGKPNYVENFLKTRDKDGNPKRSDSKPYVTNSELLCVPHEVRSIQIASQFIELTEEESWAILMHNGLYGDFKYDIKGKETPLYMLLHFSDMWCSRVVEKESEDK